MRSRVLLLLFASATWAGCGTTKWTDTARTATEQLLISDSLDRAVSRLDFRALAGKKVYLDDTAIKGVTDSAYLASTVKQHIMASGGILKDPKDQADYIVEIRAGAVGTDRHDLLFGVPSISVPTFPSMTGIPSQIPEIPLVKKTEQRSVAKLLVFVYNRTTGRIVWQSGATPEESRAKDVWIFGAGPFQRGTIYQGTKFAGDRLSIPMIDLDRNHEGQNARVSVADEAFFVEPFEKDKAPDKPAVAQDGKPAPAKDQSAAAPAAAAPAAPAAAPAAAAPAAPAGTASGVVPAGHTAPPATAPAGGPAPAAPSAPSASSNPSAAAPPAASGPLRPAAAGNRGESGPDRAGNLPDAFTAEWNPASLFLPMEPPAFSPVFRPPPLWPPGEVAERTWLPTRR